MSAKTILLVDDDRSARDIYGTVLRRWGYHVVEGANGQEAIDLALRYHPDLIILDIQMPVLDGWKAIERIRQQTTLAGTIVITLTVIGPGDDRRDPVRRGFDAHYVKPLTPADLVPIVEEWIGAA